MASVHSFREDQIALEAVEWLDRLQDSDFGTREAFSDWITRSEDHVHHFLLATAVSEELSRSLGYPALGGIAVAVPATTAAELNGPPATIDGTDADLQRIARAIGQLPTPCRRVVTLRKVYGCTRQEIATRLNVPEDAVDRELCAGARHLAAML